MKIKEILQERMEIAWVGPWITRSVSAASGAENSIEWYAAFFKNLNRDTELTSWKENLELPLKIKPRIIDNPSNPKSVIEASHFINDDDEHEIEITVNRDNAPDDENTRNQFINQLTVIMVHELNHARQREKQISSVGSIDTAYELETDIFKKEPPTPTNEREKYYLYLLDHMEQDAWISQMATQINQALGSDSLQYLNEIFQKIQKEADIIINGKILNLNSLRGLYLSLDHYGAYLKQTPEQHWSRVKKNVYSYLLQYQ